MKTTLIRNLAIALALLGGLQAAAQQAAAGHAPAITAHVTPDGQPCSFKLMSAIADKTVKIDWGDGNLVESAVIYHGDPLTPADVKNVTEVSGTPVGNGDVKIYADSLNLFYAKGVTGLTALDVTNSPGIQYLYLYGEPNLESIDLSKSARLGKFFFTKSGFHSLDFTGCPVLTDVQATSSVLDEVNLQNNPLLTNLTITAANLTSIDLTSNVALKTVKLQQNKLTSFKAPTTVDANATFNVSKNLLRMSDLPGMKIKSYTYAPQAPMAVDSVFAVNAKLDLSSQDNLRNYFLTSKPTTYVLIGESETVKELGTDYEVDKGVITFLQPQAEKVFVRMTTDAFPYFSTSKTYRFVTTSFTVTPATTGITALHAAGSADSGIQAVYALDGTAQKGLKRGLNIVKYRDGTVKKVVIR